MVQRLRIVRWLNEERIRDKGKINKKKRYREKNVRNKVGG
jgi:hypothetical protein